MADMFNVEQFKDAKFWKQGFNEFLGTMFWMMLSKNTAAADNAFAMGITYIVIKQAMSCFDSEGLHMFTPYTMFKMLENKNLDPLKGVFWICFQILGAYVGGLLGGALGLDFLPEESMSSFSDVAGGFKFFFGLMMLLQIFQHCRNNSDSSDMPVSLMMVFGFAIMHWFMGKASSLNWTSNFVYAHDPELNTNMWIEFVWTLIVVVASWVKFTYLIPAKE